MRDVSRRSRPAMGAGAVHRGRATRIALLLVLLVLLSSASVFVFGGCSLGGSSADTEWARKAEDEGWASVTDEEFDELLDSFVEENTAFAAETPVGYLEPMAIVIGASAEDPESRGAETHILAFDGTEESTTRAMRDLGGFVARSGQRPLVVFVIAEADPDTRMVLPGIGPDGSAETTDGTMLESGRVLLTIGMTVDGRTNEAVQEIGSNPDGTLVVGPPDSLLHVADGSESSTDLLVTFFEGYMEDASM